MIVTGAAMADPVTVDFSQVAETTDITIPNSLTLNGVTIQYDNWGSALDSASIDSAGIFGSTFSSLMFDFSTPATGLNFSFSLLGVSLLEPSSSISEAVYISLFNNGGSVLDTVAFADFFAYDSNDPSLGDAFGTFTYNGLAFDQALLLFSVDAPVFTVDSLSYETPAAVPIPSSFPLLASGILGLMGWRHFGRKQYL
jgi:hypothetical protein